MMYAASSTFHSQPTEIPKLTGIIFAEFDAEKGPVITYQVCLNNLFVVNSATFWFSLHHYVLQNVNFNIGLHII